MNATRIVACFGTLVIAGLAAETYRVYRPPIVTIERVEPAAFLPERVSRGRLHGTGLRPYLRAAVEDVATDRWRLVFTPGLGTIGAITPGNVQSTPATDAFNVPYFPSTPTSAEFQVPPLPPGAYDLVLFDETREVARLARAITVALPAVSAGIGVRGEFIGMNANVAHAFVAGNLLASNQRHWWGTLMSLGFVRKAEEKDWRVPARLELACASHGRDCWIANVRIAPDAVLPIQLADGWTNVDFLVTHVETNLTSLDVDLQCAMLPDLVPALRRAVGAPAGNGGGMRIVEVRVQEQPSGRIAARPELSLPGTVLSFPTPSTDATVTIRVDALRAETTWSYGGVPLRAGQSFDLDTPQITWPCTIVHVRPSPVLDGRRAPSNGRR